MENLKLLSDNELVARLNNSDHYAFTEIYNRFNRKLYWFAFNKVKDKDVADDIVQELFIDLWDRRENIKMTGTLLNYMYRSINNKVINIAIKNKVIQKHYDSLMANDFMVCDCDHLVREKQLSIIIDNEINKLPNRIRLVFNLSRKDHLNRKQISSMLNMTNNSVRKYIQTALGKLRFGLHKHNWN